MIAYNDGLVRDIVSQIGAGAYRCASANGMVAPHEESRDHEKCKRVETKPRST